MRAVVAKKHSAGTPLLRLHFPFVSESHLVTSACTSVAQFAFIVTFVEDKDFSLGSPSVSHKTNSRKRNRDTWGRLGIDLAE